MMQCTVLRNRPHSYWASISSLCRRRLNNTLSFCACVHSVLVVCIYSELFTFLWQKSRETSSKHLVGSGNLLIYASPSLKLKISKTCFLVKWTGMDKSQKVYSMYPPPPMAKWILLPQKILNYIQQIHLNSASEFRKDFYKKKRVQVGDLESVQVGVAIVDEADMLRCVCSGLD